MLVATPEHDTEGFGKDAGNWQTAMKNLRKQTSGSDPKDADQDA